MSLPAVLVVDDQSDDRELLRLVLRGAFGEVTLEEAPDAAGLARAMAAGRFGLVVTEHDLPWIRAADLVRLVRDLRPGVPIVVLTGRPLAEVATALIHVAPDAVVPKTSSGLVDLPRVVRRLLETARRPSGRLPAGGGSDADELAWVVAHDLRQPVTQVGRFLDLLLDGGGAALGESDRELLALARRGAQALETRVDGLQRYAQLGRDSTLTPVALEPLLGRVLAALADELAAAGAEVSHDPLPVVEGSAPQLEQLLQNLLANACKFRGTAPPRIHVGCDAAKPDADAWHLWVRDNGIGLDPRDAERIFRLFQRLHTEAEYPGSGIGLALCRRIVARHGGRIWVESQPGAGATFHFTLARRPSSPASAAED